MCTLYISYYERSAYVRTSESATESRLKLIVETSLGSETVATDRFITCKSTGMAKVLDKLIN